ncbi:hypothetical protein KUTeg_024253 [Tegillarca granosa]|uniref:Cadherin domain-containing protein n=1 Tax=Tegillarca granosa TaxID=220873 RepID=A0ABQ9E1D8_TEGGR|nr:hypothetical protein KUTeg_024253 [Tegillarca granosa]
MLKIKQFISHQRQAIGSPITRVEALDSDEEGPNSYLMYSIEKGNEQDIFSIGKSTGNIYLKRNYPVVNDQEFVILISAKDMGQKPRETRQELKIVLQFTNTSVVAPILSENGTRNVIISIIVVTLTLVTSAAMITVIFLLRRKDKNQALKQEPMHFSAVNTITNENQGYDKSTYIENGLQIQSPNKKKKEVSFSLDEDIDSVFTDHQFSESSLVFHNNIMGHEKKPQHGQLKTLHIHQVHLKSHLDNDLQE